MAAEGGIMPDLILRPSGLSDKPWSLQLRYHESLGETEYVTLCRLSLKTAREVIESGKPYWLLGEPKPT